MDYVLCRLVQAASFKEWDTEHTDQHGSFTTAQKDISWIVCDVNTYTSTESDVEYNCKKGRPLNFTSAVILVPPLSAHWSCLYFTQNTRVPLPTWQNIVPRSVQCSTSLVLWHPQWPLS